MSFKCSYQTDGFIGHRQVTINGSDLHSFQESNMEADLAEGSLEHICSSEDSLSALPPVGIIGLMTKQRKLYTQNSSCNAKSTSEVASNNNGAQVPTEDEEIASNPVSEVSSSHAPVVALARKGPNGLISDNCEAESSIENQKIRKTARTLGLLEAIGQLSNMPAAVCAILEPLERISGSSRNEGLMYCPITQVGILYVYVSTAGLSMSLIGLGSSEVDSYK